MKHTDDGDLFAFLADDLTKEKASTVDKHLSSCKECGAIAQNVSAMKASFLLEQSSDSRRFVSGVMHRIEQAELERFSLWREVRFFLAPSMLALASIFFVFFSGNTSNSNMSSVDTDYERAMGLIADESDDGGVFLGSDEVDGGFVL